MNTLTLHLNQPKASNGLKNGFGIEFLFPCLICLCRLLRAADLSLALRADVDPGTLRVASVSVGGRLPDIVEELVRPPRVGLEGFAPLRWRACCAVAMALRCAGDGGGYALDVGANIGRPLSARVGGGEDGGLKSRGEQEAEDREGEAREAA